MKTIYVSSPVVKCNWIREKMQCWYVIVIEKVFKTLLVKFSFVTSSMYLKSLHEIDNQNYIQENKLFFTVFYWLI